MNKITIKEILFNWLYLFIGLLLVFILMYAYKNLLLYWITKCIFFKQIKLSIYYIYTNVSDLLFSYLNIIYFSILLIYSPLVFEELLKGFQPYFKQKIRIQKFILITYITFYILLTLSLFWFFPFIYKLILLFNQLPIITFNIFWESNLIFYLNLFFLIFKIIWLISFNLILIILYLKYKPSIISNIRKYICIFVLLSSLIFGPPDYEIFLCIIILFFLEVLYIIHLLFNVLKILPTCYFNRR